MISSGKFWIGIGLSAILLALFIITIDVGDMVSALAGANYIYLIPAILAYQVSVLFRSIRWRMLLDHMKPTTARRLFPVVTIGYMANNLLPMRLGELVRSYYVAEREGVSKAAALMTIFIEHVLDALILLFFIAIIALFIPLSGLAEAFGDKAERAWPIIVLAFSLPFIVAFGTLILFAAFPERTRDVSMRLVRPLPERFEAPIRSLIDYFLQGLAPMRSPRAIAKLLLASIPIWLLEALLFLLVAFSFDMNLAFPGLSQMATGMILITAISNIGASIPAAPGGIGLFELITRETLVLLPQASVDRSVAGGFAALVHATLLLPMILLGQVFLWTGHISLRKLTTAGQAAEVVAESNSQTVSTTTGQIPVNPAEDRRLS